MISGESVTNKIKLTAAINQEEVSDIHYNAHNTA